LPAPGTLLVRRYKDRDVIVKVRNDGFEFDGRIYRSLSAIAREATGTKWNGYVFFRCESALERTNGRH
jgi:nickel-dependent lactate racemase